MEKCEYKDIFIDSDVEIREIEKHSWKPLLRQFLISSGVWSIYFMQGLYLGAPTVLIAQIRREANSTDAVTDEMCSWISSLPVISADPWVLIMPWLFYQIGRKYTCLIINIFSLIGFIIFYNSTNLYHVLISQAFLGIITAAVNTFLPIIIVEYTSPKYRGIFLTIKSASSFMGIWVSNAIGTYFHWKNIGIIGFICTAYMVTLFAWPESPCCLAMKGRYADCATSHRWLKGVNENSEKELAELINSNKVYKKLHLLRRSDDSTYVTRLTSMWSMVTSRPFYKSVFFCVVLFGQYQFSGKYVMSIYAIEVLKSLTQDENLAYKVMLILDGVTVFSMYMGCILSRFLKRRTLMLTFSGSGILILYILFFYLYLVYLSIVQENHVLTIFLLSAFSIAFGCGPIILATTIYGEIVPQRFQTPIMIFAGLYNISVMSILLKISPFMFKAFNMYGTFLFYSLTSTLVILIMYIYLPETKDKTVHEIEQILNGNNQSEKQKRRIFHTKESN